MHMGWHTFFFALTFFHICVIIFLYVYDHGKYTFERHNLAPHIFMLIMLSINHISILMRLIS